MKRIISFVVALTAIISCLALVSCATNEDNKEGGKKPQENRWLDDLPDDINLEDQVVTFVGFDEQNAFNTGLAGTYVEEDTGDLVDAALFESVNAIEERLSVDLEFIDESGTLTDAISTQLQAGETEFDILAGYAFYDISLAAQGYLLDLNELEAWGANDIINKDKSYWFTNYIDAMTYRDDMYWLVGDISTLTLGCMYVTFVGKDIYEKVCLNTYGSIYDIVRSGNWNIDLMSEMASLAYSDKNGNDKHDLGDTFGWSTCWVDVVDGMCIGAGFEFSRKEADGSISLTVSSNAHNVNVLSKLTDLKKSSYSFVTANDAATMLDFSEGNIMFTVNDLRLAQIYLREMPTDYYILPMPKYDANQTEYRTAIHDEYALFGISYASEHIYESAVVLEALCAEHSRVVRPKYYDQALKYKYTRDDESAEMIDIIRDSVYSDFVFTWANSVARLPWEFRELMAYPASFFRIKEGQWQKALDDLIASFST